MVNDILTAECTLLTVISILTGLWYNDIVKSNRLEVDKTPGRRTERRELKSTMWWKTFPLMVLSLLSTIIFVPTSYSTLTTIGSWFNSPIDASVIIVNLVLAVLSIVFCVFFIKFIYKLHKK
jgi:hypothetical protein